MGIDITWAAVGMAAVSNMATWLVILKRNQKKTTSNPGPIPATLNEAWGVIREHGEAISELKEFRGNAKEALERIEGKVDRLLERKG